MNKNQIIDKAIILTTVIDSHLSEENCSHNIVEIVNEAFPENGNNKNGTGIPTTRPSDPTIQDDTLTQLARSDKGYGKYS